MTPKLIVMTLISLVLFYQEPLPAHDIPPHVKKFIEEHREMAEFCSAHYNIPVSILLAVSALETGYGQSSSNVVRDCHNYFSLKGNDCADCCKVTMEMFKRADNKVDTVWIRAAFQRFDNPEASFEAFCDLLKKAGRYQWLFKLSGWDYRSWAHGLKKSGYATDPDYAFKLIDIIERYKLYCYELKQPYPHPYWPDGIPCWE